MLKWVLVAIMTIHGLIHLIGGLGELGIVKPGGEPVQTLFPLSSASKRVLGVVWLIAVVLFLVASFGMVTNAGWWSIVAIIAIAISQVLIIIWWPSAKWGTIANILILIGMVLLR